MQNKFRGFAELNFSVRRFVDLFRSFPTRFAVREKLFKRVEDAALSNIGLPFVSIAKAFGLKAIEISH